ncbi:MAG: T9SS type A sorting domain-containing protein [Ignavibacteria bacterium]|nr:T9SS type A sorting domain-containing protein [Ignavibacteria bacterium]
MTKSLLILFAVVMIGAVNMPAQLTRNHPVMPEQTNSYVKSKVHTETQPPLRIDGYKAVNQTQVVNYRNLYGMDLDASFELYNANRNFEYDPISKSLVLARNVRTITGGSLVGGKASLLVSTDMGSTFTELEVYNKTGSLIAMPSVSLVNIDNQQDAATLNWCLSGQTYVSPNWSAGPIGLVFKTVTDIYDFTSEGPDVNNGPSNQWSRLGDQIGISGANPACAYAGLLRVSSTGQYGTYGQWTFDFLTEDFTSSQSPTKWASSVFRNPGALTSSYNGRINIGADANGTQYAVVNNFFADDQDNRVPAVSISENQGKTWSDFNRMPVNLFDSYIATHRLNKDGVFSAYSVNSLVVTGNKKFSYFFRIFTLNDAQDQYASVDIAEAKYDNGTWTLTRVAELNGFPLEFGQHDSASTADGGASGYTPYYQWNSQGHEIQSAITADGSSILVKWVDENSIIGLVPLEKTQKALFYSNGRLAGESQIDSMTPTDVYYTYREVNGGTWNTKVNITNDLSYDKGTHIPSIIPSLTEVPILTCKTVAKSQLGNSQYKAAIEALPDMILDASIDFWTPNIVQVGMFNAINPSSVNEVTHYNFNLNSVFPNPASAEAEITFTMDQPGNVVVELFNAMGSKVATVINRPMDAGMHGTVLDATNLSAGSYHVSLSVGGNRVTRSLVVIR